MELRVGISVQMTLLSSQYSLKTDYILIQIKPVNQMSTNAIPQLEL